jgi:hypothetical protein
MTNPLHPSRRPRRRLRSTPGRATRLRGQALVLFSPLALACGAGETAPAAARTGRVAVEAVTTGREADRDGYTVTVAGRPGVPLAANGATEVADVPAGTYPVAIAGLAENCRLAAPVAPVTVSAGATTRVIVQVACTGPLRDVIVFTAREWDGVVHQRSELFAIRPDGSGRERLTHDSAGYVVPRVSADGRRVVFLAERQGPGLAVYLMDPDGRSERRVLELGLHDGEAALSPDGTRLAYRRVSEPDAHGNRASRIWVANLDGTGHRQLSPDTAAFIVADASPAWSPDGRRVAFRRSFGTDVHLYTIAADGTDLRRVPTGSYWPAQVAWSPDGRRFAMSSSVRFPLAVVNVDGTGFRTLTAGGPQEDAPSWSPDGTRIVFQRWLDTAVQPPVAQAFVLEVDAGRETQLTAVPGGVSSPHWSPLP